MIRYLELNTGFSRVRGACRKFRKDILRVGKWNVDGTPWNVTRSTLHALASNFQLGRSRGLGFPIVWNHSNDARDRLGDVVKLSIEGDTLFAEVEVCRDHEQVAAVGMVSVGISDSWQDGQGRRYSPMLVHLGVVNHPVVPNQGPFLALSIRDPSDRSKGKGACAMNSSLRRLSTGQIMDPSGMASGGPQDVPANGPPTPIKWSEAVGPINDILKAVVAVSPDDKVSIERVAGIINDVVESAEVFKLCPFNCVITTIPKTLDELKAAVQSLADHLKSEAKKIVTASLGQQSERARLRKLGLSAFGMLSPEEQKESVRKFLKIR